MLEIIASKSNYDMASITRISLEELYLLSRQYVYMPQHSAFHHYRKRIHKTKKTVPDYVTAIDEEKIARSKRTMNY